MPSGLVASLPRQLRALTRVGPRLLAVARTPDEGHSVVPGMFLNPALGSNLHSAIHWLRGGLG